jgi:hypothetical protein
MIIRERNDLRQEIASMRDSYLEGRSLKPIADVMDSALEDVLKSEPDMAAQNAAEVNPIGPQLTVNPAAPDASKPEALQPLVEGAPEQTAPGTALTQEHIDAAKEEGAINVATSPVVEVAVPVAPPSEPATVPVEETPGAVAPEEVREPSPAAEDPDKEIHDRIRRDLDEAERN